MEFLSKSGLSFFKSLIDLYFATKSYVNKAISTNTGKFWGTYNSLADLQEITGSNGDYAYVIVPDDYSTSYDRYKWQDNQWVYEYTVGGEAFDDDQWAAINSGITASDKTRLNEISENIGNNSISEMRSDIDANASEIEEINEELGDIDATLATKANVDGYYESMAVGQADNLKGQVLIPNDAAFRTSGGSEDVDTGLAHLKNVKGNTVSWNQLVNDSRLSAQGTYNGITYVKEGHSIIASGTATALSFSDSALGSIYLNLIQGRKYYIGTGSGVDGSYVQIFSANAGNMDMKSGATSNIAECPSTQSDWVIRIRVASGTSLNNARFSLQIFDLTLIYGAGNEPTSVAQFEADYQKWFGKPLTYEPYNAGELIPAKTTAIKTTGFNQWDEEWEMGTFNMTTGEKINSTNRVRSKNVIKILPSTSYHFVRINNDSDGAIENILWYDSNMNFIYREVYVNNKSKISPQNAAYLNFNYYGTTYNHDVCINLSHSGTRNGEYEPYEEHTLQLPLTTLTGKLNGTGESVTVFPDGMKKAGSAQDEIYVSGGKTYAVKRVGSVDLGSLDWNTSWWQSSGILYVNMPSKMLGAGNIIYPLGETVPNDNALINKVGICGNTKNNYVYVSDAKQHNSAADFRASLSGVFAYYELATPLIYELDDFKLPATFRVNDWGTEEQVHAEGVASVPAILNSLYAVNAVDTIRRLPQNYISQESMDNFLAQLGAAMGGTWTKTFNTTTNEWEFSFVQSASLMSVSNNEETNNEEES